MEKAVILEMFARSERFATFVTLVRPFTRMATPNMIPKLLLAREESVAVVPVTLLDLLTLVLLVVKLQLLRSIQYHSTTCGRTNVTYCMTESGKNQEEEPRTKKNQEEEKNSP